MVDIEKKLKFYDYIVSYGLDKYDYDYIEYARGYLVAFGNTNFANNLKNCNSNLVTDSNYRGFYKGCRDLKNMLKN